MAFQVTPAAIQNIVFKRKTISKDTETGSCSSGDELNTAKKPKIDPPTEEDLAAFFSILNKAESKPAILKITDPFYKDFVPKLSKPEFPKPITELYKPVALTMSYTVLLEEAEKVFECIKVCKLSLLKVTLI